VIYLLRLNPGKVISPGGKVKGKPFGCVQFLPRINFGTFCPGKTRHAPLTRIRRGLMVVRQNLTGVPEKNPPTGGCQYKSQGHGQLSMEFKNYLFYPGSVVKYKG